MERFAQQSPSMLVVEVARGGASDRAGMKVGDFITRINGEGFKTSTDADRVMRQGTSPRGASSRVCVPWVEPLHRTYCAAGSGTRVE